MTALHDADQLDAVDPDGDGPGSVLGAGDAARGGAAQHKRTYQACLPCRRRKVRCDLGSVDEPGDPPCLRCRREKKDCIFSETRRKRKADEEGGDLDPEFIARNKRSSVGLGGATVTGPDGFGDGHSIGGIHVDEGSDSRAMTPLHGDRDDGADGSGKKDGTSKNRDVGNETAAALFRQPITQPADALRMLVDAASHTETESRKESINAGAAPGPLGTGPHVRSGSMNAGVRRATGSSTAIDPQIMAMEEEAATDAAAAQLTPELAAAIQVWSTLRFVQAGWFTAREALGYIDYFYEHLAPLTPISPPNFRPYTSHARLLAEEPMLTVTMLTITSRYKKLQGPGGVSRTARIHDKLWDYLQGMITRMFWSQEQFGGGFCGAGAVKSFGDPDVRKRGLRSLGTAESLLLLSDWLPRSMHFPPGDDANELTVPLIGTMDAELLEEQHNAHSGWTEPAIRSDRMVWSLVGMAYTLSWELGVFDSLVESGRWSPGPQEKTSYDPERADRLGRMLLVYVSQACGRLGYPNMMPGQGNETNFNFLKMDIPPGTYPAPYKAISAEDRIQRAWAELTALMRQSNTEMFESKKRTHASIQDGTYVHFLDAWGPRLRDWKARFDQTEMAPKARTILTIEYEYTRTYIHSLALQAVVESVATNTDEPLVSGPNSAHTPPALISSKLVDIHKRNRVYIEELIDAARAVLRLTVTDLLPNGALHHSPVRTHFRILSAAMFLLKSFALGARESEVQMSMALLDRTVAALRKSVIDDVHLSLRIAELLNGLTTTIRRKFHRLSVPSRSSKRGQAHRSSTSAPKSAPGADRKGSTIKHAQRASQHPNGTSAAFSPSSSGAFHIPSSGDEFMSSIMVGSDLAPTLVDLKDSSISIMPPPDFMGQFNTDGYPPVSPHSTGDGGPLASPTAAIGVGSVVRPGTGGRTGSRGAAQAPAFSPTTPGGGATQPFSPLSTNSGGGDYNWVALDFNPLLQQQHGGLFGGHGHGHGHGNTHSPNLPGQQAAGPASSAFASTKKEDALGADGDLDDEGHDAGREAWMSGAFGPEISEGLEMLDAWGALQFDENDFGGVGNGSGGW